MNYCLCCGSPVKNKYCNTVCQNRIRQIDAKRRYDISPRFCNCCHNPIDFRHRHNKYCGHSCAAIINNISVSRNKGGKNTISEFSDSLFLSILSSHKEWLSLCLAFGYKRAGAYNKVLIRSRAKKLGVIVNFRKNPINKMDKGGILSLSKSWQSGRDAIRKDAAKSFTSSGKSRDCIICGYSIHTDVAHLRPVSDFPKSAFLGEMNTADNLVALCPNHHWEFDHGVLDISEYLDK